MQQIRDRYGVVHPIESRRIQLQIGLRFVGQVENLRRVGNPPASAFYGRPAPVTNRRAGFHPAPQLAHLSLYYASLNSERLKAVLVVPKLSACDDTAKTMEVDYRVYTTNAFYYVSRILETRQDQPGRNLTIGPASETAGKAITVPSAGYDKAKHLFGGIRSTWSGKGSILNQAVIEAYGSSSSHLAAVFVGGVKPAAAQVSQHGTELRGVSARVLAASPPDAIGALAVDAQARSAALVEPVIDDSDPFSSLYGLTRLSIGIGKLAPSQIASSDLSRRSFANGVAYGRADRGCRRGGGAGHGAAR